MSWVKRALTTALTAALLFGCIPLTASALDSGVTEDGFAWQQGGSKTCYIVGYSGTEKNIVIPSIIDKYVVSAVQVDAFKGSDIVSVEMRENIEYICRNAFMDCKSLESVIVSPKTESLQMCSFKGCTALTNVTLPVGLTTVDKEAFMGCTALENIELPEGVKSIENNAFNGCTSLKTIGLPTTLQSIGNTVFINCTSFCTTTIYDSIKSIGGLAFRGVPATAVINVSTIKAQKLLLAAEFKGTIMGAPVENPEDYEYTLDGDNAVITKYKGNEQRVSVPSELDGHTVVAVSDGTFKDHTEIERIYLNVPLVSIGKSCFEGCTSLNLVSLPEDFVAIGERSFYGCSSLKTVSVPITVTSIGKDAFEKIGSGSVISVTSEEVWNLVKNSGYKGEISFKLENDPADYLVVTGSGGALVKSYTGEKTKISIPQKMSDEDGTTTTGIMAYGMANQKNITKVIIPDTVTWIGDYGFSNCEVLNSVVLPAKLANISAHMMEGAQSLTSVNIPGKVREIGSCAFRNCYSLPEIIIPEGVELIGDEAFANCTALKKIVIPSTVTKIGNGAFNNISENAIIYVSDLEMYNTIRQSGCKTTISVEGCGIDDQSLITVESGSAKGKGKSGKYTGSYTEVIIPSISGTLKATTFPAQLFYKNTQITAVTVSEGIEKIPASAFSGCTSLMRITLPSTLNTKISSSAFKNLPKTAVIAVPNDDIYNLVKNAGWAGIIEGNFTDDQSQFTYSVIDGGDTEAQITGYIGSNHKISVPENVSISGVSYKVAKIANEAFKGTSLIEVRLPDSVLEVGDGAFADCKALAKVMLSNSLTAVNKSSFSGCTALKEINLSDNIVEIEDSAFENTGLETLELPKYLMKIGSRAFAGSALNELSVPDTVNHIGENAFKASSLKINAYTQAVGDLVTASGFTGEISGVPVTNIQDYDIVFTQNNTSVTIKKYKGTDSCITIPETISGATVKQIAANAFAFNEHLVRVYMPDTITSVADNAFEGCINIEYLHISKGLTQFSSRAFQSLVSLERLEFYDGLTTIPYHSCRYLFSLRELILPSTLQVIQDTAFYFDMALRDVVLPDNLTAVGTNSLATNSDSVTFYCSEKVAELLNSSNSCGTVSTDPPPVEDKSTPTYILFNSEEQLSKIHSLPDEDTVITFDEKEQAAKITVGEAKDNYNSPGAFYLFSDGQSQVYDSHISVEEYPYIVMNVKLSSNAVKIGKSSWSSTYSREICGKDIHPGRGNETFIREDMSDYKNTASYQTVILTSDETDFFKGNWVSAGFNALASIDSPDDCLYIKDVRVLSQDEYHDFISGAGGNASSDTLIDFTLKNNFNKMNWSDLSDTYAEYSTKECAALISAKDAASGTYADGVLNYETAYFDVPFSGQSVEEYPILAIRLKLNNTAVSAGWFGFKTTESIKDNPSIFCDILKPLYANTDKWQTVIIDCSKNNNMGHLFKGNWLGASFNLTYTATASEDDIFYVEWVGIFKTVEDAISAGQAPIETYSPKQDTENMTYIEPSDDSTVAVQKVPSSAGYDTEEKSRLVKKKRTVFTPGKDYTVVVIAAVASGSVILIAGIILLIVFIKKKKGKQEHES